MSWLYGAPVVNPVDWMVFPGQAKANGLDVYPKGRISFVEMFKVPSSTERNRRKRERRRTRGKR
jgi:hypothetical protein